MYQDTYLKDIGETIRRLREDEGWTQVQLAREARRFGAPVLHRQEISRMEHGTWAGSVRKLQAVLRALRHTLTTTVATMPTFEELDELFAEDD